MPTTFRLFMPILYTHIYIHMCLYGCRDDRLSVYSFPECTFTRDLIRHMNMRVSLPLWVCVTYVCVMCACVCVCALLIEQCGYSRNDYGKREQRGKSVLNIERGIDDDFLLLFLQWCVRGREGVATLCALNHLSFRMKYHTHHTNIHTHTQTPHIIH